MDPQWYSENEAEVKGFLMKNLIVTIGHPIEFARTLIQCGYEPYPPKQAVSLLGRTYLGLPGILAYIKYIKSVDGFIGCYRGLAPRLCYANIYHAVNNKVHSLKPWAQEPIRNKVGLPEVAEDYVTEVPRSNALGDLVPSDVREFLKNLSWETVTVCSAVTAAYPFHLIAVRSMAQFVGRESKYNTIWESIVEVFDTDGILGFFKGLFPRLINEALTVIITSTCLFFVQRHITRKNPQIAQFSSSIIANTFAYQYHVVSICYSVNQTSLAVGKIPYAKNYVSWYDCWVTLRSQGQLARASSLFGRAYLGPVEIQRNIPTPVDYAFGPEHPTGLHKLEASDADCGIARFDIESNYISGMRNIVLLDDAYILLDELRRRIPKSANVFNMAKLNEKFKTETKFYVLTANSPPDIDGDTWIFVIYQRQDFGQDISISAPITEPFRIYSETDVKMIFEESNLVDWDKPYHFTTIDRDISRPFYELSCNIKGNVTLVIPDYFFYIESDNAAITSQDPIKDKPLELVSLNSEQGIRFLKHTWKHSNPTCETYLDELLERTNSRGVILNDEVVSGVILNGTGFIAMLHTLPEYRRQGLARLCMTELIQSLGLEGYVPCCSVDIKNHRSQKFQLSLGLKQSHIVDYILYTAEGFDE